MAKAGLCAFLVLLVSLAPALAGGDPDLIADRLAMQRALQQGRDLMARKSYETAVQILEAQLEHVHGDREYLMLLRDAYRELVRELRLANRESDVQVYQRRLQYLDPGAYLDQAAVRPGIVAAPPPPATRTGPVARAAMGEESKPAANEQRNLVQQANQEFEARHFENALRLFEKAGQVDPAPGGEFSEQWAYCKIYQVVRQLNEPRGDAPGYAELGNEVRLALSLAPNNPKLKGWGAEVLEKLEERRLGRSTESRDESPAVSVRHRDPVNGWSVAETTNFRIFHNQSTEYAERVARIAEKTRLDMQRKWFGTAEDWKPICDIVLHNTADEYSQRTHESRNSPGHSTIKSEGGKVVVRRIDLHWDDPNLLVAVLPHEATHVVLAGRFGSRLVPRWADEGMAVLTEPREKVERHLRNLPQHRQDQTLMSLRQLVQLEDYPEPRRIGAFYAESVSLVDFLCKKAGPQVFTHFLRDGMQGGYERALQQHYGYRDFADLEKEWTRFAFQGEAVSPIKVAGR